MKVSAQWLLFVAFLPKWQIMLLSLIIPFILFLLYYSFIYTDYQRKITQQKIEVTQQLTRIHHHQIKLNTEPSLNTLIAQQKDYEIPLNYLSANERLQHLLINDHFIPDTWENTPHSLYKLRFTLSYSRFLTLLRSLNQSGLSLVSLNIIPTTSDKLSVQMSLVELSELTSVQGDIS